MHGMAPVDRKIFLAGKVSGDGIVEIGFGEAEISAMSVRDDLGNLARQRIERRRQFVNLGTGKGISVLEMVKTFEATNNCKVPYRITGRRAGDIAECYADPEMARQVLGWQAEKNLNDMVADTWCWQQKNPEGY